MPLALQQALHSAQDPRSPEDTFPWDACFVTGIASVDAQHRSLVELLNRFGLRVVQAGGMAGAEVDALFEQLAGYAREHFADEERLMAEAGIGERHLALHRAEHAAFVVELGRLRGVPRAVARPLHRLLVHWLTYHILGMDQTMARQLAALRAGVASPESAHESVPRPGDAATGMLLRALHALFVQVSERNGSLVKLNETLESRVAERTRELLEANRRLEALALTDVLTGLPNRRAAMDRLHAAWRDDPAAAVPLACIVLDADGFKPINDRHGHDAGDEVLRRLAVTLPTAVRTDDAVYRMGGDEFLVVCPRTPAAGAWQVAEKLRRAVAALRVQAGTACWRGSVSLGVSVRDAAMARPEDLLKCADRALYQAKALGRNRVVCSAGDAGG